MIRTALPLCLSIAVLAAPVFAEDTDHLSEKDGVRVLHAWSRATDDQDGALYFEIDNTSGKDAVLIGAESDFAQNVTIIATSIKAGGEMEVLPSFSIPAGTEFDFGPEGIFLKLHGLKAPLVQGEEFEVHLEFEGVGEIEAHVEIEAADAESHGHAGHNH